MIYATRGLVEVLLEFARDAEPESLTAGLSVTRASEFPGKLDVDGDTPVFTHFYLPEAGESVAAVFGVDLATPVGQTQGRFISHPQSDMGITLEDDLHGVVLVAVPPWGEDSIAAFARNGRRRQLTVLDVEPPRETLG